MAGSYREGAILRIAPHSGSPGMLPVTFVQLVPLSRVMWSNPSLVPAQMSPLSMGDSAIPKTVAGILHTDVIAGEAAGKSHFALIVQS